MAWWEPTTGSFTCVAAYQAIGADDLATSYVNLANPGTNDAAPGDAPTFSKTDGWTFNGSSDYLTTGLTPGSTWTMLVRFSNRPSSGTLGLAGATAAANAAPFFAFVTFAADPNRVWFAAYGSNGSWSFNQNDASGVIGLAEKDRYFNGVSQGALTATWSGTPQGFLIGALYNTSPTVYRFWGGKIQAVAIYSTKLDATQMAEISSNMAALPVVAITGEATLAQESNALSSASAIALAGSATIEHAGNTLLSTGEVDVYGQLVVEQSSDTLVSSGLLLLSGAGVTVQSGDTLVSASSIAISAGGTFIQEDNTLYANGLRPNSGVAIMTQDGDTLYATLSMANLGSAAIMQASNTLLAGMVLNRFRSRYRGTVRSIGNIRINEV